MYLIGHLDKALRPLVLMTPETSEHVKTFKLKMERKINTIN